MLVHGSRLRTDRGSVRVQWSGRLCVRGNTVGKAPSTRSAVLRRDQPVIPRAAIGRLSLYLRQLETFLRDGRQTVSSAVLGRALGVTDAQVRKDLAHFGQFGHPGVGYRAEELIDTIKRIFGTDRVWPAALVGIGNLGRALMHYGGLVERGFQIVLAFDNDPAKVGQVVAGNTIQPLDEMDALVRPHDIQLGIIAVPAEAAQGVADKLVAAGVHGLMNFAPGPISVRAGVGIVSVDLAIELEQLCFQVQHLTDGTGANEINESRDRPRAAAP